MSVEKHAAVIGEQIRMTWDHIEATFYSDVDSFVQIDVFGENPIEVPATPVIENIPITEMYHLDVGKYEYYIASLSEGNKYYFIKIQYKKVPAGATEIAYQSVWVKGDVVLQTDLTIVNDLRVYLHDDKPSQHYKFSPPDYPEYQFNFNKASREHNWEDHQLDLAIRMATSDINVIFPITKNSTSWYYQNTLGLLFQLGMVEAFRMAMTKWIHEEFEYNVGSLSFTIDKAGKYRDGLESIVASIAEWIGDWKFKTFGLTSKGIFTPSSARGFLGGRIWPVGFPSSSSISKRRPF